MKTVETPSVQAHMDCLLRTQAALLAIVTDIGETCGPDAAKVFAVEAIRLFSTAERITREAV